MRPSGGSLLDGLRGGIGGIGQLGPNAPPVVPQITSSDNTRAQALDRDTMLNRYTAGLPVTNGCRGYIELFRHQLTTAQVARRTVQRVLSWDDGEWIDLHACILTRRVFIGQHHMFTHRVFNPAHENSG